MAVTLAKKVYDFKMESVKSKLVTTFRRRRNESTIADLVAVTGLPKHQVEQATKVVLDEYGGHCKVTESGEILYHFPHGMHSRTRGFVPVLKRFLKGFFAIAGKVLAFLFKIWIMAMLVGYFILFLAVIVAAVVLAIGASASSRSDSRRSRGSGGAFFLVMRLLELFLRIFFWVSLTKGPSAKPKGRPLYKSVFGYVFGDRDPNQDWEGREKIRVLSFIRSQKGVITAEELMALTGRDYDSAQQAINSYLVEFEGEPSVTDAGSLYYFFPELLRTKKEALLLEDVATVAESEYKKIIPFSENKGKTNGLLTFFNAFNLAFGSYFTAFASIGIAGVSPRGFGGLYVILHETLLRKILGVPDPNLGILIVLGLIPLSFSLLFFLIPLIRRLRLRSLNENIRKENLRKRLFGALYFNPGRFNPLEVKPGSDADNPARAAALVIKETDRFAGVKQAEIEQGDDGATLYQFKELEREISDIAALRRSIDLKKYEVGKTVFDTNA